MWTFERLMAWWAARMAELLPFRGDDAGRDGAGIGRGTYIADAVPGEAGVALKQRHGRGERPVVAPKAGGSWRRDALLRLQDGVVLERLLVLPLAAEPELPRVVQYEIDRISPFAPHEVAAAHVVERRDRAAGRIHVRVGLLPLQAMAAAIGSLRSMGLVPRAAIAPRSGGGTWRIALAAPVRTVRDARYGLAVQVAVACCAVLALAAVVTPFVVQQRALDRADAAIARLRPAVDEATALRRRMAEGSGGVDAAAAEEARVGHVLGMMATLSSVLPDDTYLTNLAIRQRVVALSGRSAAAARLIALLAADPAVRNAGFAAPVTRVDGARGDVFSLRLEFGS